MIEVTGQGLKFRFGEFLSRQITARRIIRVAGVPMRPPQRAPLEQRNLLQHHRASGGNLPQFPRYPPAGLGLLNRPPRFPQRQNVRRDVRGIFKWSDPDSRTEKSTRRLFEFIRPESILDRRNLTHRFIIEIDRGAIFQIFTGVLVQHHPILPQVGNAGDPTGPSTGGVQRRQQQGGKDRNDCNHY